MITIYTAPSCTSCKKAKTWLSYHHIPFNERNLIADPLSTTEISQILQKCDDGVEVDFKQKPFCENFRC